MTYLLKDYAPFWDDHYVLSQLVMLRSFLWTGTSRLLVQAVVERFLCVGFRDFVSKKKIHELFFATCSSWTLSG